MLAHRNDKRGPAKSLILAQDLFGFPLLLARLGVVGDQFGRTIGLSGEGAQKAAQKSSHNIEAIVQSGTVLSEITQRLFEAWADITRARMDRGFDRIDALLQCRTPQDFAAVQSELLRDNMETFLGYARKVGEHSARLADEAKQRFASAAEGRRAA